jgi:hypothetical protein
MKVENIPTSDVDDDQAAVEVAAGVDTKSTALIPVESQQGAKGTSSNDGQPNLQTPPTAKRIIEFKQEAPSKVQKFLLPGDDKPIICLGDTPVIIKPAASSSSSTASSSSHIGQIKDDEIFDPSAEANQKWLSSSTSIAIPHLAASAMQHEVKHLTSYILGKKLEN